MKTKEEQGLTVISLIVIVIVVIFGISLISKNINSNKYMKEIKEITEKACNYTNFEVKITDNISKSVGEKKVKGNLIKYTVTNEKSKLITYMNTETNEQITIMPIEKIILSSTTLVGDIKALDFTLANKNRKDKYKFDRIEKYKGKKCYVVKYDAEVFNGLDTAITWLNAEADTSEIKNLKAYEYIDMETGFVVKQEVKNKNKTVIREWEIKTDCVTDKDLEKPDLTEYKKY